MLLGDLLAVKLETGQLFGGAGENDRAAAVADGQHRGHHRADLAAEVLEQFGDVVRLGIGHRDHGWAVPESHDAATAGHQRPRSPDELGQRQKFDITGATGAQRLDGQHTLRVPGHRDRRGVREVQALADERADRGDLGEQHPRQGHRGRGQLVGIRNRFPGGQFTHPAQRFEADGPHHDEFVGYRVQ